MGLFNSTTKEVPPEVSFVVCDIGDRVPAGAQKGSFYVLVTEADVSAHFMIATSKRVLIAELERLGWSHLGHLIEEA